MSNLPPAPEEDPLARRLLLGVDRMPAPAADAEQDPAEALLENFSLERLLRRGTQPIPTYAESLPEPVDEPAGTPCSRRSVQHLQAILDGHHAPALPEFARLLAENHRRLPPESLPDLLEEARLDPEFWHLIAPVIGARGHWLLRRHPDWSALAPAPERVAAWYAAPPARHVEYLTAYRRLDAAEARDSLTDHWLSFDHRQQAKLLPALREQLDPADEPFLEHCRAAKRKAVRVAACELLADLPASALSERLWTHAHGVVQLEDDQITINLPDALPTATKADGIYPTGSKAPGGLRLNWLLQLLERVPFVRWENAFQRDARALIPLFARAPHGVSLLGALTRGLLRHPHPAGARAVIKWWLLNDRPILWDRPEAKALLRTVEAAFFNETLVAWLQQFGPFVPQDTLAAYWLLNGKHPWQPALSKLVVYGFRDLIQGRRTDNWRLYHYRPLLEQAAYRSDPALFQEFKTGWSFRDGGLGAWHADLEKMLQILHFRMDMKAELKKA